MTIRRLSFLSSIFLIFCGFAVAQDDDPIRVESSIVRLNVGVVNQRGSSITDLRQSSFEVFEDGVKQQITKFEPVESPFSVVLVLDMSGSTIPMRQVMKQSAIRFLDALSPQDRVAVVEFYDKVNLRNDFTSDRRAVVRSIEVSDGRGKTQFYKAISFSLEKLAKEKSLRKAIVVISDGVDTALQDKDRDQLEPLNTDQIATTIKPESSDTLVRLLERSDAQGVTIYPLALPTGDPAKLADPTPRQVAMYQAARNRLKILADRTGGTLNAINRLEDMGRIYSLVAADLRTLYTIEYQPANDKKDGKWRSISIAVNDPTLISRTRQGYFAK